MIEIVDKTKCSGCGACAQICARNSIIMEEDNEGFLYPKVNKSSCVNCGRCLEVCQYITPFQPKEQPLNSYAYVSKNIEIRKDSSSGGVFTKIAEYILSQGGTVYGAAFDQDWNVILQKANDKEGLNPLRKSKYVQAQVGEIYRELKQDLINDKQVLFVSTPCQVNGLNHYLGKTYKNLYTVDFICHSIPSPKVWRDYISSYKDRGISLINFRNKTENGWNNYSLEIKDKEGRNYILEGSKENLYMRGFLQDLFCRPSCSNCASRCFATKSDIMIGDFWNVESYHAESKYNDNKGVSLCMSLTEKGEDLIKHIDDNGEFLNVPFYEAELEASHICIVKSNPPHRLRRVFFKLYKLISLRFLIWICIVPYNWLRKIYSLLKF